MVGQTQQPDLPTLDPGVTLLEVDDRTTGALHSLVLDHLVGDGGDAVWVDAHGHGTTQPLARIAPSMRLLNRVAIAHGFTPWQHFSLLRDLPSDLTDSTALGVLPAFDWFYRSDDCSDREGDRLFAVARFLVADLAANTDIPLVLTRTADDDFTSPLADLADDVVHCKGTRFGPRFAGEDFETLVYPSGNETFQTTLAYWQRVLAARHPALASPAAQEQEVTVHGAD
ncbi:hypothetical protein [Halomicrococcus sp. NG-SE-24]|uniref:hypothetical protein n=1 Tax=Halomicrococcus sp. NG-SE-24 TaxID=3436928 RepID=UPI003D9904D4